MLFGTRQRHVEKAALLLHLTIRLLRHRTGEEVLLHTHHIHHAKLQPLGRMDGHQGQFVFVFSIALVHIHFGKQRDLTEKISQQYVLVALLLARGTEVVDTADKFLQVLLSAQSLGRTVLYDVVHHSTPADDVLPQVVRIAHRCLGHELLYQRPETLQLRVRTFIYNKPVLQRSTQCLPKAHSCTCSRINDFAHRGVSYATGRIVDDALQCLFVVRVHRQAEVGDNVLYLLALVERNASVDATRDGAFAQGLFKDTALCIGAVEDGLLAIGNLLTSVQFGNLVGHDFALLNIAIGTIDAYGLATVLFRKHLLANLFAILGYQAVGRLHDDLCRAVVLLQFEEPCPLVLLGELQYVVDVCPTEGVDALCIVAHHTHPLVVGRQLPHDGMLGIVRVLILVHQYVAELPCPLGPHLGMLVKEQPGIYQQVIKVHGIRLSAPLPVPAIDVADGRHTCRLVRFTHLRVGRIGRGEHQPVLGVRDVALHRARLVGLVIELHLLDDALQQALRIACIVDGEVVRKADAFRLHAQDA